MKTGFSTLFLLKEYSGSVIKCDFLGTETHHTTFTLDGTGERRGCVCFAPAKKQNQTGNVRFTKVKCLCVHLILKSWKNLCSVRFLLVRHITFWRVPYVVSIWWWWVLKIFSFWTLYWVENTTIWTMFTLMVGVVDFFCVFFF